MRKFFAGFAALILAFELCACARDNRGNENYETAQQASDVIISQSESGHAQWVLYADKADFYQDAPSYSIMQNPHIIFKKNDKDDSDIKSETGRYDIDRRLITMSGNVVGISKTENAKIETEKIFYDMRTKKIWSDANVLLTRGGLIVKGKGLKANSDFSEIEIFKQQTKLPKNIEDLKAEISGNGNKL
ncbi:MAG: LPS export ABC transporter periplasmic protein LptC [Elusimicrobiota bacterium]|jgi:LPS export ABC transporter protein LptC|nr:LPS export ABC transporter periplasmic protein LptC [Elusimicrobiota bacterium]